MAATNKRRLGAFSVASTAIVAVVLYVELASALRLYLIEGNTAFVRHFEAMLLLGPWNHLVSAGAVQIASGVVPLLVIFVAPAVVGFGVWCMERGIRQRWGAAAAGVAVGALAMLHVGTGISWGLLHTSWGP